MTVTKDNFAEVVIAAFPQLRAEIEEDSGLVHVQMGTLRSFGEISAATGDLENARHCVALVDSILADCDPYIQNGVYVSFVENIEKDSALYKLLTPKLLEAWHEVDQYFEEMARNRSKDT